MIPEIEVAEVLYSELEEVLNAIRERHEELSDKEILSLLSVKEWSPKDTECLPEEYIVITYTLHLLSRFHINADMRKKEIDAFAEGIRALQSLMYSQGRPV